MDLEPRLQELCPRKSFTLKNASCRLYSRILRSDQLDLYQLPVFQIWRETEVIVSVFRCLGVSVFRFAVSWFSNVPDGGARESISYLLYQNT